MAANKNIWIERRRDK